MYKEYSYKNNWFSVGKHRLHYVDEGEGKTIVMVHGNPTWSYYYRRLIKKMSQTHRVIALDNIGCGLSDKPQKFNYILENHIDNLEKLISHLKIKEYSLVVHDWGGAIGFGCAVRNMDAIEKIVVLNTAAFRSQRIPLRIGLCRLPIIGKIIVQGCNGFAWPATFMAVTGRLDTETKKGYLAPYDSWGNRIATHRFVQDIPLKENHVSYTTLVNVEEKLKELANRNIPLLICWGGKDFCFNDYFYEEWKERFPDAITRYYPNAGHYVLEDAWEEVSKEIQVFFTG